MRRSDSTYDDIDPEDPIQDLANSFEEQFLPDDATTNRKGGLESLVADLLNSPQIQEAVNNLVAQLLQSAEVKKAAQTLLKELWDDLVADPETLQQIIHLLQHAIQDEKIKEAAIQLVTEVFGDKEVLDELVELVQRLGQEKDVQVATQALLVDSAHNALNDPEILDHSMEFATDVVGDDVVQQTAGEALYNTLSYAVRPTLSIVLSMLGAGLIVLSVLAFRNANSPEDAVEEVLLKTLESTNMDKIWKLLAMPFDLLVSAKEALVWLVSLPFRFASQSVRGVGRAGVSATSVISRWFQWLFQLPTVLFHSIMAALGTSITAISTGARQSSQAALAALSDSILGVFFKNLVHAISDTLLKTEAAFASTRLVLSNAVAASSSRLTALSDAIFGIYFKSLVDAVSNTILKTEAAFASTRLVLGNAIAATDAQLKMAIETVARAYSQVLATIVAANSKVTTGVSWLQKTGSQALQDISNGYDYLNELATAMAFFIEDLLLEIAEKAGRTKTTRRGPRR